MDRTGPEEDRYVLHRVLGEGAAGRVWLAEDRRRPGSRVAIKELAAPEAAVEPGSRLEDGLRHEFALLYSLRHPGLAEAHELDHDPVSGLPRFSQEWIDGRTIVDAVAHEGPESLIGFAAEALRTLRFVHGFKLVHRDIKPDNLLVRERSRLGYRTVLVDFGLATGPATEPLDALRLRGTLPYLAPELFDNQPAGPRTDLYALGAVLYEAIHRHPPFVPDPRHLERFVDAAREGRRSRPPLPERFNPGLTPWLETLLAPKPADRPRSAEEALDRLNAACATQLPLDTPADRAARLISGPPAGREAEIERIWQALEDPAGPRLVFVHGKTGSGKTRLLRWLFSDAVQRGWRAALGVPADGETHGRTLWLIDDGIALSDPDALRLERLGGSLEKDCARAIVVVDPIDGAHPRLTRAARPGGRIDLGPLDLEALRRMAERANGGPIAEPRARELHTQCDGRPALAEALLIDASAEHDGAGGRAALLSESARCWLDALAVYGDDATDDQLATIAELDPAEAALCAQEAVAAGLVWNDPRGWRSSPSLRTWLRSRLEPERAAAAYRTAIEQALPNADDSAAESARLARLQFGAGESELALERSSATAERLEQAGDPGSAARQWARSLWYLGRTREGRGALRMRQGEALLAAGRNRAAVRAFSAAQRWATSPGDRLQGLARRALAYVRAGRFEIAFTEAEKVAHRSLSAGTPEQLALARQVAGIALARSGREREALPLLDDAWAMLERLGDHSGQATILHTRAACRLRLGRIDAEADFLAALKLYETARAAGAPDDAAEIKTRIGLAVVQTRDHRLDLAEATLEQAGRDAAAVGQLDLQQVALSRRAVVALERGTLDRAIELAAEAADLSQHLGDFDRLLVNRCHGADARIRCGRAADAVTELRQLLDGPLDGAEPSNVDYARMVLADALRRSDRGNDAAVRDLLDGCRRRCRRRGTTRPYLFSLVLELERRADPRCPDAFDAAWSEFETALADASEVDAEIHLRADLARAQWALEKGRHATVAVAARAVLDRETGTSPDAYHAQACALLAQALDRSGEEEEAARRLEQGRELLTRAAEKIADEAVRRDFSRQAVWATLSGDGSLTSRDNHARLLALYDMLRVLNSAEEPESLLQSILDLALKALGAERGMVLLKERNDRDEESFTVHLARNLDADTMDDVRSYSAQIVAAAAQGQSLLAIDAGTDERFQDFKSVSLYGIRSLLCVPLRSGGQVIGTVYLDSRRDGKLFTQDDLRFLEAFADQAALTLGNVMDRVELEQRNRQLQALAETRTSFHSLIGRCPEMQRVFDLIEKFAATDLPVLVHGESGTGKEIVARAIHLHGPRRKKPFVSENCAAIPETLLETELFGHVRGAFTGAERDHPGLFEQAHCGTLFLDEIGDMSAAMQARLLRVLEEGVVRRVGGEKSIEVDVRVLAATHRDLTVEVQEGRFREDLFYRLQVLQVALPALRDRPGDVALLCRHFLDRIAAERELAPLKLTPDVLTLLQRHRWPGNVRQLENTLQRLIVLADDETIDMAVVRCDPTLQAALGVTSSATQEAVFSLDAGEKEQLEKALEAAAGNRSAAARLLNVSRATLYRKLRRHGL